MKTNANKKSNKANLPVDICGTALKNYGQAFEAGLKLHEETWEWWSQACQRAVGSQGWQKWVNKVTDAGCSLAPLARERMEELMSVMENSCGMGADLMKQAIDAAKTPAIDDSREKWMELRTLSMTAARTNTAALTKIGSKAVDSWLCFVRKNAGMG